MKWAAADARRFARGATASGNEALPYQAAVPDSSGDRLAGGIRWQSCGASTRSVLSQPEPSIFARCGGGLVLGDGRY
ncbi:MAG: hypothetical protein KDA91_15910 [Planctomycetaceae bacterium]|nr:hypothetical protein [Planctomycetaceae bacterium]